MSFKLYITSFLSFIQLSPTREIADHFKERLIIPFMLKLKVQQKRKHLMPFTRLQQRVASYSDVGHTVLLKVKQCSHCTVRNRKEDSFLMFFFL